MRLADVSLTTGYGIWTAGGNAPHATWRDALLDVENDRPGDRTYGWRKHLAAFPERADVFEQAMNHLRPLVNQMPEKRYLIHSDLLNYNVLVSGNRLSAVLDWGCSTYGDFLYDVATLRIWTPWYPNWGAIIFSKKPRYTTRRLA